MRSSPSRAPRRRSCADEASTSTRSTPDSWRRKGFPQAPSSAAPCSVALVVGPDHVARRVLKALRARHEGDVRPHWYRAAALAQALAPGLVARLAGRSGLSQRLISPACAGGTSRSRQRRRRTPRRERECTFPCVALAPGELEVVVELPRVRLELRTQEDEPIGLEELAEIDVRQRARVRRVPRALEAVAVRTPRAGRPVRSGRPRKHVLLLR